MVIRKKANLPSPNPDRRLAAPRYRPTIVYSRDDTSGSRTASDTPARILIVEDDFLVALDIEAALIQAGFEIAGVAGSAEEALKLAKTERPTLAVMDIRLIGLRDGIDAALELFGTHGVRSIFATAHHDQGTRARAAPAKPLAWVPKPYAMGSLVEAIRDALRDLQGDKK